MVLLQNVGVPIYHQMAVQLKRDILSANHWGMALG